MHASPRAIPATGAIPGPVLIEPAPPIPLPVLDTNVVLDWIAFADPRVQPLVDAVERGAEISISGNLQRSPPRRVPAIILRPGAGQFQNSSAWKNLRYCAQGSPFFADKLQACR
jgi:hypothetical protein